MLPQAASIQIVYCRTLCKPRGSSSFALQYGNYAAFTLMKELTDLGFHALGLHRDRVSKFLTPDAVEWALVISATLLITSAPMRASPEARLTPAAIDANSRQTNSDCFKSLHPKEWLTSSKAINSTKPFNSCKAHCINPAMPDYICRFCMCREHSAFFPSGVWPEAQSKPKR